MEDVLDCVMNSIFENKKGNPSTSAPTACTVGWECLDSQSGVKDKTLGQTLGVYPCQFQELTDSGVLKERLQRNFTSGRMPPQGMHSAHESILEYA